MNFRYWELSHPIAKNTMTKRTLSHRSKRMKLTQDGISTVKYRVDNKTANNLYSNWTVTIDQVIKDQADSEIAIQLEIEMRKKKA